MSLNKVCKEAETFFLEYKQTGLFRKCIINNIVYNYHLQLCYIRKFIYFDLKKAEKRIMKYLNM